MGSCRHVSIGSVWCGQEDRLSEVDVHTGGWEHFLSQVVVSGSVLRGDFVEDVALFLPSAAVQTLTFEGNAKCSAVKQS